MTGFSEKYALWDEFLKVWPVARLATMTLDEYTLAGSKDSFTYWIESRLDELGSIWGGSAFKFGVYSRKDTGNKPSGDKLSYSDTHAWYSALGDSAEAAFANIRESIMRVAALAASGDLNGIETLERPSATNTLKGLRNPRALGEAYKWKIAFHYQNRVQPSIVAIFTKGPLAAFAGASEKESMATLQQKALDKRPSGTGILEFGEDVWARWKKDNPANPDGGKRQADPIKPPGNADDEREATVSDHTTPINRIYYGPPGTGKTWQLSQLLKQFYEQAMASVSGREWRDAFIAEKFAALTWWEGAAAALYEIGGSAKVGQLFEHPFIQAIAQAKGRNQNVRQTLWGTLQNHTVEQSTTVNLKARMAPAVFDKSADSAWQLAGDWHDACADLIALVDKLKAGPQAAGPLQRYSMVTFHQSYGYEEFVEGLRPVLGDDADGGEVRYEIRSGVFKELCRRARLAPGQRFAMVIDEINRGNISKIFGELITLIEADKREGAENALSVVLPYSGESFSVPANVDLIGTMNTADRSLALLDTALRRRFDFVALMPDARDEADAPLAGLRVTVGEQVIDIPRMLRAINQRIEVLYDRDHCIGHAYLMTLTQVDDGEQRLAALSQVFRHRIVPLLEEYFFEDWQKIRLVLADNQKSPAAQFVVESGTPGDELARLFGRDHGLDTYATKPRHAICAAAFANPDAYIGIYQTLSG